MFNNLIESSSHRREFKRRGSFILFTSTAYALLFVIAGVVSIYAFDARLADQNTEIVTLLTPADFPSPKPHPVNRVANTQQNTNPRQTFDERRVAMTSVSDPHLAPRDISTAPNPNLPVRGNNLTLITDRNVNGEGPGGPIGNGNGTNSTGRGGVTVPEIGSPPEPAPTPAPKRVITSPKVLNSLALELPKPPYPPIAKQMHLQGLVSVQVLIDETGRVVSARTVSGSPFLAVDALRAAYKARFSPTFIGDQPVKVSGVIAYNFVLQ